MTATCPVCRTAPPARVSQLTIRGTEPLCYDCRKSYWSARNRLGWPVSAWIAHHTSSCAECGEQPRGKLLATTPPIDVYLCGHCRHARQTRARDAKRAERKRAGRTYRVTEAA